MSVAPELRIVSGDELLPEVEGLSKKEVSKLLDLGFEFSADGKVLKKPDFVIQKWGPREQKCRVIGIEAISSGESNLVFKIEGSEREHKLLINSMWLMKYEEERTE